MTPSGKNALQPHTAAATATHLDRILPNGDSGQAGDPSPSGLDGKVVSAFSLGLQRRQPFRGQPPPTPGLPVRAAESWRNLDPGRRTVAINGEAVELTSKEFDLAVYFFSKVGHLVTRSALLEKVWGRSRIVTTRTVDAHVSRIRKKLAIDESHGWRLISIYQHGYRLERLKAAE